MFKAIFELALVVGLLTGGGGYLIRKAHHEMLILFAKRADKGFSSLSEFTRKLNPNPIKLTNRKLKKDHTYE